MGINTKHCILIDDDIEDQEIFLLALKHIDEDIRCTVANNGLEGLEMLKNEKAIVPDLIFIDINMPKMNGIECLVEIRKLQTFDDVKIIVFSTSSDSKIIQQSKNLGANEFLIKPPGFGLLIKSLAKIIKT